MRTLASLLAAALLVVACSSDAGPVEAPETLTLTSTAFADGGTIPIAFTCDAGGRFPPLASALADAALATGVLVGRYDR